MPPIDFNGLDTVVHGPVRLGVLTALQTGGPLDFTTLKKTVRGYHKTIARTFSDSPEL